MANGCRSPPAAIPLRRPPTRRLLRDDKHGCLVVLDESYFGGEAARGAHTPGVARPGGGRVDAAMGSAQREELLAHAGPMTRRPSG